MILVDIYHSEEADVVDHKGGSYEEDQDGANGDEGQGTTALDESESASE